MGGLGVQADDDVIVRALNVTTPLEVPTAAEQATMNGAHDLRFGKRQKPFAALYLFLAGCCGWRTGERALSTGESVIEEEIYISRVITTVTRNSGTRSGCAVMEVCVGFGDVCAIAVLASRLRSLVWQLFGCA